MSKWDESQYIFQRMDRTGHIEYKSWSLFFAFLKVPLPLTTSRRHRKWKLTRGEESDTDSGGESGGEVCSHLQSPRQTVFDELGIAKENFTLCFYRVQHFRLERMEATRTGT